MLKIKILNKKFGSKIILNNIEIEIIENGIIGIIGKNGAGKSTFFNCIKNLTSFEGNILLNGIKINQDEIAFCPTEPVIYDELTSKEFSNFYLQLLEIRKTVHSDLFELPLNIPIKKFSTGMKKKSYLNAVLQKKYKIYIFDEPFNGLDLESNHILIKYITEISKESIVFVSSHILEVLYKNCDLIFLLKNKKLKEFKKVEFINIENEIFN